MLPPYAPLSRTRRQRAAMSTSLASSTFSSSNAWGSVFAYGLMMTLATLALVPLLSALK